MLKQIEIEIWNWLNVLKRSRFIYFFAISPSPVQWPVDSVTPTWQERVQPFCPAAATDPCFSPTASWSGSWCRWSRGGQEAAAGRVESLWAPRRVNTSEPERSAQERQRSPASCHRKRGRRRAACLGQCRNTGSGGRDVGERSLLTDKYLQKELAS